MHTDDFIIFCKLLDNHMQQANDELVQLDEPEISLIWRKSEFFNHSIKYFGHVIHPGKLKVDASMTNRLRKARLSKNDYAVVQLSGGVQRLPKLHQAFANID